MPLPRTALAPHLPLSLALLLGCPSEPTGDDTGVTAADSGDDGGSSGSASGSDGSGADSSGGDSSGDSSPLPDGCDAPSGAGTDVITSITEDETWTAAGSPYRVPSNVYLTATLTLEACTVVQVAEGARIFVGNDPEPGSIVAHGEIVDGTVRPVRFERLDQAAAWGAIELDPTGFLDAEHVVFDGGGEAGTRGTLVSWGLTFDGATTPNLRLVDVTVTGSGTHGINLQRRAAFTEDSTGVHIEGSGAAEDAYPIWIEAGAVHSLPQDLTATGNAHDAVLIDPFTNVDDDTFPARGLPLVVANELYLGSIEGPPLATLTIEPGVELLFGVGASSGITIGLDADHQGRIVAQGTVDAPIVMRSAQPSPSPADWLGLYYRYSPTDGNLLEHVTIANAGAPSGAQGWGCGPAENDASVLLLTGQAMTPFLHDVTFEDAGGDTQVIIGWLDESPSATAQAWFEGNTFAASPTCRVSLPRDVDNGCPGDAEPDCL